MPRHPPIADPRSAERRAFEFFLRTGRRLIEPVSVENKFNPYHDPRNGQFTFAPGGPRSDGDTQHETVARTGRPHRAAPTG